MGKGLIEHGGSETLKIKLSRSLPSTARTSDVRFAGFHNRVCSCVPVTAEHITRTVRAPLDLPSAACSSTVTKLRIENFSSKLARCPPPVSPLQITRAGRRHAPDPKSRRVVRSAATVERADSRNCRASRSAGDVELVLCLRPLCPDMLPATDCNGHMT